MASFQGGLQHLLGGGHPKHLRHVLLGLVVSTGGTQTLQPHRNLRGQRTKAGTTQGATRTAMMRTMMNIAT